MDRLLLTLGGLALVAGAGRSGSCVREHAAVHTIEGRFVVSEDLPGDEEASIVLEVRRSLCERGASCGDPDAQLEFERLCERVGGRDWIEARRAPLAADGSFAFVIPTNHDGFRVRLDGRYLDASSPVYEQPPREFQQLSAEVLGRLTVTLLPPRDWSGSLVGREVALRSEAGTPLHRSGRPASRLARSLVTASTEVELRAADTGPTHWHWSPSSFAPLTADPSGFTTNLASGEHARIELRLVEGVSIEGRVWSAGGEALCGAVVSARAPGREGACPVLGTSRTDANGAFRIACVHPRVALVTAESKGFETMELELPSDEPDRELTFRLSATPPAEEEPNRP